MTDQPRHPAEEPDDPARRSPVVPDFGAVVDAALSGSSLAGAERSVEAVRRLLALLREAPLERPSPALRQRVRAMMSEGSHGPIATMQRAIHAWLASAERVVMQLVTPGPEVGLAGFRGAAAPLSSYRVTRVGEAGQTSEMWLDVHVERGPTDATRIRGQISADPPDRPVLAHAVDTSDGSVVATAIIDDEGEFLLVTDRPTLSLVIELEEGTVALVANDLSLRRT